MEKLRAPFPAAETGQLPKGGTTLAYVGHAAITGRLLDVDPAWNWEPLATTVDGLPLFDLDGQGRAIGLWIRLTVCGVTRLGYGSCPPGQFDAVKVLVGDALRNAAMRFGVALDLWVKGSPELPQEQDDRAARYLSGLTIKTFLDACAAAGLTPKDIDEVVQAATLDRTSEPTEVFVSELDDLRRCFDIATAVVPEPEPEAPPVEDKVKPGKKVSKGDALAQTEGVSDLKVGSGVV